MSDYETIKSALYCIPPSLDRETWLKLVTAIKSDLGEDGFDLVNEWSQGGDNYNAKDMRSTYRSIKANGRINIATLFYHARQNGYNGSRSSKPNQEELGKRKQQTQQNELKEQKLNETAAQTASKVYGRAIALNSEGHAYLTRKKVQPVPMLRVIQQAELEALIGYPPKANEEKLFGPILIAPFKRDGKISTIEMIDSKGLKCSLANGKKSEAYWCSRELNKEEPHILIAEGIATALSATEATGLPAVSTGSCHNTEKVAKVIRRLYPNSILTILADLGNGEKNAEQASILVNGKLVKPDFGPDRPDWATDFNDLAALHGIDRVKKIIMSVVPPDQIDKVLSDAEQMPIADVPQVRRKKLSKNADDDGPDHLEIAREVIQQIDRQNILCTASDIWIWEEKLGVWRSVDDRKIKKLIIENCAVLKPGRVTKSLVEGVMEILKTEVFLDEHQWNVNQEAINVANGELIFNPAGWQFGAHVRENYNTTQLPVTYDSKATCPLFKQYLEDVFRGEKDGPEKAQVILEMIGYTMVSHARLEKFILLIGNGANGKSVLLAVLQALIGAVNCSAVQPSQFGNEFHRAHLHLKLANIVSELNTNGMVDDTLKAITSGEPCLVSRKFKDPFVMKPYSTCWFATNHMPSTNDFSNGMFRRAIVITFNRQFKEGVDIDTSLKDKVTSPEELSGIFNLAIDAYAAALNRGKFTEPLSCIQAKDEWRLETDQAAQFAAEKLYRDPRSSELSAAMFTAYTEWAIDNGIKKHLNKKNLSNRLKMLGATLEKGTGGVRQIRGFGLSPLYPFHSGDSGDSGVCSDITPCNPGNAFAEAGAISSPVKSEKIPDIAPLTPLTPPDTSSSDNGGENAEYF